MKKMSVAQGWGDCFDTLCDMGTDHRLNRWLKRRGEKRPQPGRLRRLIVESLEPRLLFSGEALILPPPDHTQETDPQSFITTPTDLLGLPLSAITGADQTAQPLDAGGTWVQRLVDRRANEVVFVDGAVRDRDTLLEAALGDRLRNHPEALFEVVLLDSRTDGLRQMTQWLQQHQGLNAIHILSHGDEAALRLGSVTLDATTLESYVTELTAWGNALGRDGDILLYGCNVAEGPAGRAFLDEIGHWTQADMAASTNQTGASQWGGDWDLEYVLGTVETAPLASPDYLHLLSVVTPSKSGSTSAAIASKATDAFSVANTLGLQLDASTDLSFTLPMVDLAFSGLIMTNDGRTLGDLLSFKTTTGTTVLADYLAKSGAHTMGGLMDLLGEYLNGTGSYSHLESLVDHAAGSPAIQFSATADTLDVNLTLSRAFVYRFGFDEALKPLGFSFQLGQGIPLVADIDYSATYHFTDGTVAITNLAAQVKSESATLDVEAVLGILDVTATGKVAFDTGQVAFSAIAPVDTTGVKSPSSTEYQASDNLFVLSGSSPKIKANLSFDLAGASTTSQAILAGTTPHVNVAFGGLSLDSLSTPALLPTLTGTAILSSGQTLEVVVSGATYTVTPATDGTWSLNLANTPVPTSGTLTPLAAGQSYVVTAAIKQGGLAKATVTGNLTVDSGLTTPVVTGVDTSAEAWSEIPQKPLIVTSSQFSAVQPFSSLDSAEMVRMLQDLGTYLELLRDSGRFDAMLPFTNLTLGDALDFSAAVNHVIDNRLVTTLVAGITASKAISPFITPLNPLLPILPGSAAFDLYLQRPGDDRVSVVTIAIDEGETLLFRHINQLAELIGQKITDAVNGWLAWSGALFEVEETLKGGMTLAGTDKSSEEQTLKIHASSGSYQLKLGAGGTLTGSISVLASALEVQNALEAVLGAGNVVVTGRPKQYQIQFAGDLADANQESLVVVEGGNVTAGSVIDVTTSDLFRGSDGRVWGKINLLQANPGEFSLMRVAPSSAVKVTQISGGSDTVEAVQRVTIIHGGGSTFTLSGTDANGVAFTTGAISATTDSAGLAAALSAKLPTVTGLSVADVSSDYAADNATRVFEIGFGKKSATLYGSYARMTADAGTAGVWTSSVPAQGVLATWQEASAAVGGTPAKNEIQRLSLSNATGGQFSIGVSLGGVLLQTTPIDFSGGAAGIQTALISMFRQFEPAFSSNDCSVTAVAGKSNTYDIEFKGIWAAENRPQMRLNTQGLTSAAGNDYAPLTQLGMLADGQDMEMRSVTAFVTFTEMMERFQQAVNDLLPAGTTFSLNPRYDVATKSLMFDAKLAPAAVVQAVPLALTDSVGDLSALSADTTLDLSTEVSFESTIGFDFANLNTFALRASGAYVGTITANAQDTSQFGWLAMPLIGGDAVFTLNFDGEAYELTVTQASTTDNTSRADLMTDFQTVLDAEAVLAGGVLGRLGFANLGELVTIGESLAGQLQFSINAPLNEVRLTLGTLSPMSAFLGFKSLMMTYPMPKAVVLANNGQLSAAATFQLSFDQTDRVTVTLNPDATNTQTTDLVDDLNAAFAATNVAGHAYLGSGGKGFSHLGEVVQAILRNKQIEIVTLTPTLASLQLFIDGVDPAMTELGFTPGQFANTSGAYLFLQDPHIHGRYGAVVYGQSGATPGPLTTAAQATLGMLNLTADQLWTDLQGSMDFDLRNGLTGLPGERISLNALFDSVSSQESLLGLGGALRTSETVSATAPPYLSNGQLLRDVGLRVTVGSVPLDVTVLRSATLSNSSVAELAANVDDAIHAALMAELGSDPYAAHTFVTTSNIGTAGAPIHVLTFAAPTTVLTLAANPTQIYDADSGVLLTDLRLAVTVGGLAQPVDVVVRTSRTTDNQSLDALVSDVAESIRMALNTAKSNTDDNTVKANLDTLIAATDLVGKSGATLTLKSGVVAAKEIILNNLVVKGRLREGDFVTTPLFLDQAGTVGSAPTATLKLSGIDLLVPTGMTASGLVPTTEITIDVSNMVNFLGGAEAMTTVTVVPSNGLGTLTPFKGVSWSTLTTDFARLSSLLGNLGGLGPFGELGRALPMLGTSVSSLFDFSGRLDSISDHLARQQGVGLLELRSLLATAFGMDESAITLENDNTVGKEALRIIVPYRVVLNEALPVDLIFNDSALLALLSDADKNELLGLVGSLRELKDTEGSAKCQFYADMTFQLALGIDLGAGANQGRLFLYDHVAAGAAGLSGDQGTFARLDTFSATASGITFQSNQGIYSLGVTAGTADLTLTGSGVMLHSDAADGADDGRLYLGAFAGLSETNATALKKTNFEVIFDGSSSVVFPLTLTVSDELGQLAMEQIDGFINPLPLGKMELHFLHLGETFAKMGGKSGYTLQSVAEATDSATVISSQVQQAALPERPSTGNGISVTTPEGAPVDDDNEAGLEGVTLDPFYASTAGAGASTTPSSQTVDSTALFSATPQPNPSSDGFDISLIIPDVEYWQLELTVVLEHALGPSCDPDKPVNGPLLFLLRDPTLVVNTVDKVLETIQKGLDAFSDVLSLPIIGDQLREATQFVADLRFNVVKALNDALTAAVDIYGGLDNALRMFLFDMLTTDTDNDFVIEAPEVTANPFLNFLQDYNGDGLVTPDDIVVEYLAGVGTPRIDPAIADYLGITQPSMIPAILPGQRTAWVTSGQNLPNLDSLGAPILHEDGTPCYIGDAGDVILDPTLRHILDDIAGAIDSMAETAESLMGAVQGTGEEKSFFDSLQNVVTFIANKVASGYNYQSLLRDVFGAGVTAAVLTDVMAEFTPSALAVKADLLASQAAGTPVVTATLAELKAAVKEAAIQVGAQVALAQSTAIQFRMHLGQTYTPQLDLSFDIGVPGLPLSLELDGGIGLELDWDLYLGFGIDIKDGFYLVTNMPGTAGIGEMTTYDPAQPGVATGVVSNHHDLHIDNLWLVGKPTFTPAVKEIQAQINVFLAPGAGGQPTALNANLFVLNGTLTDNWDGWIRDNDTGIWGSGTDSMGRLSGSQSANYGRTTELFDGDVGADGSRTRLQLNLAVDLKDKGLFGISALSGLTNGRLTFNDMRTAKLADLVAVEWDAKAQVNLHMELGISLGGEGYLPKVMGDFHMTWQESNKNPYVQQIEQYYVSGYDKLFHVGAPNIWMTDIYLDAGTFFAKFLNPIAGLIQDITDPIMPVIDALTTPIPGLSDIMGRDYSTVDLASDMSAMFGGISQIDFIVAMVNLLDVIDNLPTDTAGMLIPVTQAFVVSGSKDRKLNLSALPTIPGLPDLDVPVDLPYEELADITVNQDGLEFSLNMGVGWKQDTTLLTIFQGDMPPLEFDFDLSADVKISAPYVDLTPVEFTIDGLTGVFRLNLKAGWQDLRLSDILSGNFVPQFDVTLELPTGFDWSINTQVLPVLNILMPKMTWQVGTRSWEWASGAVCTVDWPDALSGFVDPNTIKTIDLTGASFNVNLGSMAPFLPQIQVKWPTVHWIGPGKEFVWTQTRSDNLGWSGIITDTGLLAALVDPARTITVQMPDVWLPSISLSDLLPDIDFGFDFGLPSLPSFPEINIDLPDIDMPGQQTVSLEQSFTDFQNRLKKPGSALAFPILDDPVGSVIALLTGSPADLVTFTPNNLNLGVGFRVSFPVYPPLYVGIGGSVNVNVMLTLGFDTYGISKFLDSHNLIDILDGFYVGDNIVNGVDKPEITLEAKLFAFAELNAVIVRGGVEGGIKLTGTLDIYDEDKDNKYRASELIAAVSEDPLDVVEMHLRGSAYISAYVDLNLLIEWVRVYEWTFMDVTLFEWEHDPSTKKPVLGSMDGSVLTLHTGSTIGSVDGNSAVDKDAGDRLRRSIDDGNESYTLTGSGGTVNVSALLPNGQTYTKTFVGVTRVKAFGGAGDDILDASALDLPVLFIAGGGTDILKGGSANDILIGSDSGSATLIGGGGEDLLLARGGTTLMQGGTGKDSYRFLGEWGTAVIEDANGDNVIDFSAQTQAVNVDDAYFNASRSTHTVTWDGTTTIDLVQGGSGSDVIDFSGDAANLLVTVTGSNAGWVKGAASGMTQTEFDATTRQDMVTAGDNAGRGFKFVGFENIIGGQGSDVFRIRDGAYLSGSLSGDTDKGAWHNDSGNEAANARNTIDFSEYTAAVKVDLEGASAFGSGGETNILVRGFHNIFGGAAGDRLSGDGRNNMIVGNNGTDFLEGKAAHDLLVADTFLTYKNLLSGQTRPAIGLDNVTDYLTLQAVGAAEFGAASRNWIWKGQTIENISLSITGKQTLKGGSGNDMIFGALGGDLINVGGSGEGNDTILGDLGKVEVDFNYRTALSATTFGSRGGGGDTIYLGSGSNLVLAGSGRDQITGSDSANSFNIILADNGTVQFRTEEAVVAGQTKLTFKTTAGRSHLLDFIQAPVAETGGLGNDDTVNLASGSGVVFGGAGDDAIYFHAASSTGANNRFIAGDHARIDTDNNGGVISFRSLDLLAGDGGDDRIIVGNQNDLVARYLGNNMIIAGVGADTVLVSASQDTTTGLITSGAANSTDIILGDNGEITRWDSVAATTINLLKQVNSTELDVGGGDTIHTANGDKVIVGGEGGDTITVDTNTFSKRYISGDNVTLTYDTIGGLTDLVTTDTALTDSGAGDVDLITIGQLLSTVDLGENLIAGGMGGDTIQVLGATTSFDTILADNGEIHRNANVVATAYALRDVHSTLLTLGGHDTVRTANGDKVIVGGEGMDTITIDTNSLSKRHVSGDNVTLTYDTAGGLTDFVTTDTALTDSGAGDVDQITIGQLLSTVDLGENLISGGMGGDTIQVLGATTSFDTILADNGEIHRNAGTVATAYALRDVHSTLLTLGGHDTVRTANGNKVIVGGEGMDTITIDTNSLSKRHVSGDNVTLTYDTAGGLTDLVTTDTALTDSGAGDLDLITIGQLLSTVDLGENLISGGMGGDTIQVLGATTSFDTILADNGEIHRNAGTVATAYALRDVHSTLLTLGGHDTVRTANGDKVIVGGEGMDTITIDTNSLSKRHVSGDNVTLTYDTAGGLTDFVTTDTASTDSGAGDVDQITIGQLLSTANLGENLISGGMGGDTIQVLGATTSFDTILADNGEIHRNAGTVPTAYALRDVHSTLLLLGFGGHDTVRTANGDKVIVGGYGQDGITVESDSLSKRHISGDNVTITYDTGGGLTDLVTMDTTATTGDNDTILLGIEFSTATLGENLVVGGMGNDLLKVFDTTSSEDVLMGDNGAIHRTSATATSLYRNRMLQIVSTVTDKGGHDTLTTGSGGKVIIGGFGTDTISAVDGDHMVIGDNGVLNFDADAKNGIIRHMESTDTVIGGGDTIVLREGYKVVIGGYGADAITVFAGTLSGAGRPDAVGVRDVNGIDASVADVMDLPDVVGIDPQVSDMYRLAIVTATNRGLANTTTVAQQVIDLHRQLISETSVDQAVLDVYDQVVQIIDIYQKGHSGRYISGDNVRVVFDTKGSLTSITSTDAIAATGGADAITLGARNFTGDLGYQVVIAGMAEDQVLVRADTTSEDVIFGDNAEYKRHTLSYEHLRLTSLVPDQGDGDTILSGRGTKIVVGGFGGDTITLNTLNDSDSSTVLGDSGQINFSLAGSGLVEKIESLALSFGGYDTVRVGDGEVTFVGGFSSDQLTVNSTRTARRVAVGDNALLSFGVDSADRAALTSLITTDQNISTGGADKMMIGPTGSITGTMGDTLLVGGMSTDTLVISGGSATATLVGDNVNLRRTVAGHLLSLTSVLPDQGGGDQLKTVSGDYVIVGGMGGDLITAGSGLGIVTGDSATLVFDASGSGVLKTATSLGLSLGGDDTIELGSGGATSDGHKVVIGGYGADAIMLLSVRGAADNMNERSVAGDNAALLFNDDGRLANFRTLDADLSTGGSDRVTLVLSGDAPTGSPLTDFNVVAGGMMNDSINVIGATRSRDVLSGDNLDYRRAKEESTGLYQHLFADLVQPRVGGADTIRTGSGDKLIFGGAGADRITTLTAENDRNILFGDAGSIAFDTAVTGIIDRLLSTAETSGGSDVLVVGGGESYLIGGLGKDSLTFNTADTQTRLVVGDNGQINFTDGVASRMQSTDIGTVDELTTVDIFKLPAFGSSLVLGGPGIDLKSGGSADDDEILPGSGTITVASRIVSVVALGEYEEMGVTDFVRVKQPAGSGSSDGSGSSEIPLVLAGEGQVQEDTTLEASGRLTYPALDGGMATFVRGVTQGSYGNLTMGDDGSWQYQLDNTSTAVQRLNAGDSVVDLFLVETSDQSRSTVTITVLGAKDPVVFSGDVEGVISEDRLTQSTGQLVATDVAGNAVELNAATLDGTYGQLALSVAGGWTYTLANTTQAVQSLGANQTVRDAFTVTASSGDTTTLTLTIQGSNDLPVVTGGVTGTLQKDVTTAVGGRLTIADADTGESAFQAGTVAGTYGSLLLTAGGEWSYALANNTAVQAMGSQTATDRLVVRAADATEVVFTFSVTGNGSLASGGTGTTTGGGTTGTTGATAATSTGTATTGAVPVVAATLNNTTTTANTGGGTTAAETGQGNVAAGGRGGTNPAGVAENGSPVGGVGGGGVAAASTGNEAFAQMLGVGNRSTAGTGGMITPMDGLGGTGPGGVHTTMTVGNTVFSPSSAISNQGASGSITALPQPQGLPSSLVEGNANSQAAPAAQPQALPTETGQGGVLTPGTAASPAVPGAGQGAAPLSDATGSTATPDAPVTTGGEPAPANAGGADAGVGQTPDGGAAPVTQEGTEGGAASPAGAETAPAAQEGGDGATPDQGAALDDPGLVETAGTLVAAAAGRIQWQPQKTGENNRRTRPLFDWGSAQVH